MDCTLAGECVNGSCVCDGWTHGTRCNILNLEPASATAPGYRNASGYNSWGGASIQDPVTGKWYLFASQIAGKCALLGAWSVLSEGVRLVSTQGPTGPWVFDAVVLPTFAHNIKPFRAPDGTWLIFYIGSPNNSTRRCDNTSAADADLVDTINSMITSEGNAAAAVNARFGLDPRGSAQPGASVQPSSHPATEVDPPFPRGHGTAGPIFVASASAVDAPPEDWTIHGPLTDSLNWHSATNPSAVFNPNGTVSLAVSRGWEVAPGQYDKTTVLMQAESWRGPYVNLTDGYAESIHTGEDPDMFRTRRGWHMLNHNTGPGSSVLSYSLDGLQWVVPKQEPNAFNLTVPFDNGTVAEFCQRQRPQIVMASDGMPGWLWSGVMVRDAQGNCPSSDHVSTSPPTWTLAQPIGRKVGI